MDNNRLLVLEPRRDNSWQYNELAVATHNLKDCLHIVFTSFTDSSGKQVEHVWMSYNQRSVLVSFNARTREQRYTLNCDDHKQLRRETNRPFYIMTLMCAGRKLFVGTTVGVTAVFDSETFCLLKCFSWHNGKVRALQVMPKQAEPCVCAEIPFPDPDQDNDIIGRAFSDSHRVNNSESTMSARSVERKREEVAKKEGSLAEDASYLGDECFIRNSDPESAMVISVGDGKMEYCVDTQNVNTSTGVVLLTWKS